MLEVGFSGKSTFLKAFPPVFLGVLALFGADLNPCVGAAVKSDGSLVIHPCLDWNSSTVFSSFRLNSLECREVVIRRRERKKKKCTLRTTVRRDKDKRGFCKSEGSKGKQQVCSFYLRGFWEKLKEE